MVRDISEKRYSNARSKGFVDQKKGPQSCAVTDLDGCGAEFAFCREVGSPPNLETNKPDSGWDTVKWGMRIDVKQTAYPDGRLLAKMGTKVGDCDIYALMIGSFPRYRHAGWTTSGTLIRQENVSSLRRGLEKCYNISQKVLNPSLVDLERFSQSDIEDRRWLAKASGNEPPVCYWESRATLWTPAFPHVPSEPCCLCSGDGSLQTYSRHGEVVGSERCVGCSGVGKVKIQLRDYKKLVKEL